MSNSASFMVDIDLLITTNKIKAVIIIALVFIITITTN